MIDHLTAYDPALVNDLATIPLVLGMILAGATGLTFAVGSPWYKSLLGVAFLGIMVTSSLPLVIVLGRRLGGEYPGYEWVAIGLYSLFALAWLAMLCIILIERHRAPVTIALRREATMATKEVQADARQRSIRTLLQGLAVDVLVAIGGALLAVLGTIEGDAMLTAAAWVAIATAVLKSVLTAVASFLARLAIPPQEPPLPVD